MKTKHYDLANAYDRNYAVMQMEHLAKEIGKRNAHHVRLIEQGGGFAILPDTNRLADIGEKEFAKAFHLGEIPQTAPIPTSADYKQVIFHDGGNGEVFYLQMTEKQIDFLKWLLCKEILNPDFFSYTIISQNDFEKI